MRQSTFVSVALVTLLVALSLRPAEAAPIGLGFSGTLLVNGESGTVFGTVANHTGQNLRAADVSFGFVDYDPTAIAGIDQLFGLDDTLIPDGGTSAFGPLFSIVLDPSVAVNLTHSLVVFATTASGFASDDRTLVVSRVDDETEPPVPEAPRSLLLVAAGAFGMWRARRRRLTMAPWLLIAAAVLPSTASAQSPRMVIVDITAERTGARAIELSAVLENRGGRAEDVRVSSVRLAGQAWDAPSEPVTLGRVGAGERTAVGAVVQGAQPSAIGVTLTVQGTYALNGRLLGFTASRITPMPVRGALPVVLPHARTASIDAVKAHLDTLAQWPVDDAAIEMQSFLASRPEFVETGLSSDLSLSAQWVDGSVLWIPLQLGHNPSNAAAVAQASRLVEPPSGAPASFTAVVGEPHEAPPVSPSDVPAALPQSFTNLPASNRARFFFSYPERSEPTEALVGWMLAAGYQAFKNDGTIGDLKANVGGDGMLYWETHGGVCTPRRTLYCALSASRRTPDLDAALTADLTNPQADGSKGPPRVVIAIVREGGAEDVVAYAITRHFVERYWKPLSRDSFIFMNTCNSAHQSGTSAASPAELFRQSVFSMTQASVYAGWSEEVQDGYAWDAARLVFDRLLGADPLTGHRFAPEAGAPQRAFTWRSVVEDLLFHEPVSIPGQPKGLSFDPKNRSVLQFFENPVQQGDGFGLLAPSIERVRVLEDEQAVEVDGIFGLDSSTDGRARQLQIGGVTLRQERWLPTQIRAFLPAGVAGPVVVSVGDASSNPAMLTAWDNLTFDSNTFFSTLREEVNVKVKWRADIRPYRQIIHQTPVEPDATLAPAPGSSVRFRATGQETCVLQGSAITWTILPNDATLTLDYGAQPVPLLAGGQLSNRSSGYLSLWFPSLDYPVRIQTRFSDVTTSGQFRPLDWERSVHLPLLLDGQGTIVAGQAPTTTSGGGSLCSGGVAGEPLPFFKASMAWKRVAPRAGTAPKVDTPR